MNTLVRWFAVAGLIVVVGCATTADKASEQINDNDTVAEELKPLEVRNALDMKVRWAIRAGAGSEDRFAKLAPRLHSGRVFVASRDGQIGGYDAADGKSLWTATVDARLSGGPAVGEGYVLVVASDAQVFALDSDTGERRWMTSVSSEVLASPVIADGMVVVQTNDGKLFGLKIEDGQRVWVYDRAVPVLTLRGTGAPLVVGDKVIAGFASGRLVVLNLRDGSLVWDKTIAVAKGRSELERMVDIDSEPKVLDGAVYVVSYQGRVAAVELESGRELWTRDMSSHLGLSVQGDRLYVTDVTGSVWCLDRQSGTTVWKQDDLKGRSSTAPSVSQRYIVVGASDGSLFWLAPDDGRILATLPYSRADDKVRGGWRDDWLDDDDFIESVHAPDPVVIGPPIIDGDMVYARYQNGVVAAVEMKSDDSH